MSSRLLLPLIVLPVLGITWGCAEYLPTSPSASAALSGDPAAKGGKDKTAYSVDAVEGDWDWTLCAAGTSRWESSGSGTSGDGSLHTKWQTGDIDVCPGGGACVSGQAEEGFGQAKVKGPKSPITTIVGSRLFFRVGNVGYATDSIPANGVVDPAAASSTVHVHAASAEMYQEVGKGGNSGALAHICIGDLVFTPKN